VPSKMKGIDSTGAPLVHVPGWVGVSKSRFKDCLQQSKIMTDLLIMWSRLADHLKTGQICSVFAWSGFQMPASRQNRPFKYWTCPVFRYPLCLG
jgi:hypothetical protein